MVVDGLIDDMCTLQQSVGHITYKLGEIHGELSWLDCADKILDHMIDMCRHTDDHNSYIGAIDRAMHIISCYLNRSGTWETHTSNPHRGRFVPRAGVNHRGLEDEFDLFEHQPCEDSPRRANRAHEGYKLGVGQGHEIGIGHRYELGTSHNNLD